MSETETIMNEPGVIINETIDGAPEATEGKTGTARRKAAGRRATEEKVASTMRSDTYLWGLYLLLLLYSIIELYSASSSEITSANVYTPLIRHGIFLAMGIGIMLGFQKLSYVWFKKYAIPFAVLSLGLLIISSQFGININGAQRAIMVAGVTIQPAEMVKLAVVLLLSYILARYQMPGGVTNTGVALAALVVVVFCGCLWRNGLTNTLMIMCISVVMFVLSGMQFKKMCIVLLIYIVCGGMFAWMKYTGDEADEFDKMSQTEQVDEGYVKGRTDRTETHKGRIARHLEGISPDDPITDDNRQVMFARFAQANGGIIGGGPGNSRESARLPLAFSDYIFSIIVEDGGLIGASVLVLIYLSLLARAGFVATKCRRAFPAFLIMGCAVLIVFQALIHMAIVTGLFPVSGQPLPFISKGGTSVLIMSMALGMMLSVSRSATKSSDRKETKAELSSIPEDIQAVNPTMLGNH